MIAINASNLHSGGGLQVGISFLYELSALNNNNLSLLHVFVSSEIHDELLRMDARMEVFGIYEVINTYGIRAFYSKMNSRVKDYSLVFTIFGPNYLRVRAKFEVIGFAQSWILNFDNPISRHMSFIGRNILRIKFYFQWLFFLRANHYIVELEHVKNKLITIRNVDEDKISIVHNTVSSLYSHEHKLSSIVIKKSNEVISLGIVTRDYPHKNLKILPFVAELLGHRYDITVHFYTTLNDFEWSTKDDFFKKYVSTVGPLSPCQCPSFYEQIDGVLFPSLLECFSATPLEAMVMGKPLFASDRDFVHDVCANHAIYFDPLDVNDIACKIATYFNSNDIEGSKRLASAKNHALDFSNARVRAEKYLEIICQKSKGLI